MSQRERWIVYPLLFFSFALAIRDQVPAWQPQPEFNVLKCRHLIVQDANGGPAVDIYAQRSGISAGSGVVVLYSGSPPVGTAKPAAVRLYTAEKRGEAAEQFGAIETYGPLGSPATQLTSDPSGGAIHTFDLTGKRKHYTLRLRPNPSPGNDAIDTPDDPRRAPPSPPQPAEAAAAPPTETAAR